MHVTKSHCGVPRKMLFSEALVTLSPEASFRATSATTLRQNNKNHLFPSRRLALFTVTTLESEQWCVLLENRAVERMPREPIRYAKNGRARHRSPLRSHRQDAPRFRSG